MRFLILLLLSPAAFSFEEDHKGELGRRHRAECQMWSQLENKTLPLQNEGHAHCATNEACNGFFCNGVYQGNELSFGLRVLSCQSPPGVEVYGHAPQHNAKNFSHIFSHDEIYDVPGQLLNMTILPPSLSLLKQPDVPEAHPLHQLFRAKIKVQLERNDDGKSVAISLTAMGCIKDKCIATTPVFNHSTLPVPKCEATNVGDVCDPSDLNSCGTNQICLQSQEGRNLGVCKCLVGYEDHGDKKCISQTGPISNLSRQSIDDSPSEGGTSVAAICLSLLFVAVLIGGAAFAAIRTRMVPRLRARFANSPYGDMLGSANRSSSTQNVVA